MNGRKTKQLRHQMNISHPIHAPWQWRLKKKQATKENKPSTVPQTAARISKKRHSWESRQDFKKRRTVSNDRRRTREKAIRIFGTLIAAIFLFILAGCAGWSINGITLQEIDESSTSNRLVMLAGVATSFGTHFAGHAVYYELNNIDWRLEGFSEMILNEGELSESQRENCGRAGFISQLAIGVLLKTFAKDNPFTTGYLVGTTIEIWGYPLTVRTEGAIDWMNSESEWVIYSTIAGFLLIDKEANDATWCPLEDADDGEDT